MSSQKNEFDDENESFLPRSSDDVPPRHVEERSSRKRILGLVRILVEVGMAVTIVFLLASGFTSRGNRLRRSPVPDRKSLRSLGLGAQLTLLLVPRKIYKFHNDPQYIREDMFFNESDTLHTLHNWIPLSSASRGYTVVDDASRYDLPEPYTVALDRFNDGPGYMMSVFHQLHCLSYLAEHFQQGYGGIELTTKVAHHSAHCFNYLRQGITCSADTTLEGKTGEGPGEGSEHECVDYDALLEWANEHAAYRWRNALLPEESIL